MTSLSQRLPSHSLAPGRPRLKVGCRLGQLAQRQRECTRVCASSNPRFRVRRARVDDAAAVARICECSFEDQVRQPGVIRSLLLSEEGGSGIDLALQVRRALERKEQATLEHRTYRLEREHMMLKARLAMAQGDISASVPPKTCWRRLLHGSQGVELRKEGRWRAKRRFMSLVAVVEDSGEVIGCSTVCMMSPEALLPPPFPTSKQSRFYVSNIAVDPAYRRQGVATALLGNIEVLASRWCMSSVWMHVDDGNEIAQRLYWRRGYQVHARDPLWNFGRKRYLLRKKVQPWTKVFSRARVRMLMEGDTRAEVVVLARGSGSGETRRFMRGSGALSPAEAARSTDIVGEGVESGEGTGEGGEAERKKVFVWTDVEADRDETGGGRQRAGEAE